MWLWHRGDILLLLLHLWASTGSGKAFVKKGSCKTSFSPHSLFSLPFAILSLFLDLNKKELSLPVSLEAREALDVWIIPL